MSNWIQEHFLLLMLAAAAVFTFAWLLRFRARLRMTWYAALVFSILHVLYGVTCVKVFAVMEGANAGAMSIFGAVFFMPVGYFLCAKVFKRPMAEVFDICAVPMIFTLLLSRCNCLHAGCCLGRYMFQTQMRWPTREAEIVFYLVFLALIIPRVWKGTTKGRVYPLYMAAYGAFRAVIECFRVSSSETLFHLSHVWAFLALALGLSIYIEMNNRTKQHHRKKRM
ncbi:MAG: prolipoprotein diacylglyceryl transferase [Oscillospiraceae bacterium]|nr:prolipoprotein diacylglyceryl transferase [Oscillospiraceae bacterium]